MFYLKCFATRYPKQFFFTAYEHWKCIVIAVFVLALFKQQGIANLRVLRNKWIYNIKIKEVTTYKYGEKLESEGAIFNWICEIKSLNAFSEKYDFHKHSSAKNARFA